MRPDESFVGQSIRSLQTMLRVIAIDGGYIPTVVPDGIYGATTMQAVSAFQRYHGLPVSGVTDNATWDKIYAEFEPARIRIGKAEPIEILMEPGEIFVKGDASPYIYLMQSMLIFLSGDHTSIPLSDHTGIMDDSTQAAVSAFQSLSGLPVTGEMDRITWLHLSRQFTLGAHHKKSQAYI